MKKYEVLVDEISTSYARAQRKAARAVNTSLLDAYWEIGRYIVEYEQNGQSEAIYGVSVLESLSKDLYLTHGKGFSLSNLRRMRQLYSIGAKPSRQLAWSHHVELLKIRNPVERNFYENQAVLENWSVSELIRQKKAALFLRLSTSQDTEGIVLFSGTEQTIRRPIDLFREPYVLDFLKFRRAEDEEQEQDPD